jgi:hypothetical protein
VIDALWTILRIIQLPFVFRRAFDRRRARAAWSLRREVLDARFRLGEIDEATWRMESALLGRAPERS